MMIEEIMMKIVGTTISYESMNSEIIKGEKMKNETTILIKIIADIAIVATVGFPILIFHLCGVPYERGFFCNDDSIRYPFKDSTVSTDALYSVGILLPVISMFVNEFYEDFTRKRAHQDLKPFTLFGRTIPPYVWCLYRRIGIFIFGACVSQLTTDIAKYSIGRLRPHFIDVCKPNVTCISESDPYAFIKPSDYICTDPNKDRIREARLSFPSGHSSFSAYTMVYLTLYVQGCMHAKPTKLLRPFLQFLFIMMTWYTSLSRVSDNKHHWSDVLIGFLQGAFVAVIVAYYISDIFEKKLKEDDRRDSHSTVGVAPVTNYNTIDLEQH